MEFFFVMVDFNFPLGFFHFALLCSYRKIKLPQSPVFLGELYITNINTYGCNVRSKWIIFPFIILNFDLELGGMTLNFYHPQSPTTFTSYKIMQCEPVISVDHNRFSESD